MSAVCGSRVALVFLTYAALSCAAPAEEARRDARLGGDVIAVVDGEGITREDVVREMRARGVSAREALDALEAQVLLAHEAARLGVRVEETTARRRALAQSVLFAIERSVPPSVVSDAEARAAFATLEPTLTHGEQRAVTHVLARPRDGGPVAMEAARAFALEAIAFLREQGPGTESLRTLRERAAASPAFTVSVESISPFERDAELEPAFLSAAFSRASIGVVETPVQTSYGFHAVYVTSATPAHTATFEQNEARVRRGLVAEKRAAALNALFTTLAGRRDVTVFPETAERYFTSDSLSQLSDPNE